MLLKENCLLPSPRKSTPATSWRDTAQAFPTSVSPTAGGLACAPTTTESTPQQRLPSTGGLGKPAAVAIRLQLAWQSSALSFAEEFQ